MSTEASATTYAGVLIPLSRLDRFKKQVPQKSHMEDCWDPKTGIKLSPIEIIDEEAHEVYVINGKQIQTDENDEDETVRQLCEELMAIVDAPEYCWIHYDSIEGSEVLIGRALCSVDGGNVNTGYFVAVGDAYQIKPDSGSRSLAHRDLVSSDYTCSQLSNEPKAWADRLHKKLGIKADQSGIMTVISVG